MSALNPSRKPFNGQIRIAAILDKLNANVYWLPLMKYISYDDVLQELLTYLVLYFGLWYDIPMDTMSQKEIFLVIIENLKTTPLTNTMDLLNDTKHLFVPKFVYTNSIDWFHYDLIIHLQIDRNRTNQIY